MIEEIEDSINRLDVLKCSLKSLEDFVHGACVISQPSSALSDALSFIHQKIQNQARIVEMIEDDLRRVRERE